MFTVYEVVHRPSSRRYIGVHKTDKPDDGYYGSGRAIRAAIKKYGRQQFLKTVLFVFDTAEDAYAKERELTVDFNKRHTFNMRLGGVGGFTKETAQRGNAASVLAGAQKKGGASVRDRRVGIHSFSTDQHAANGRRGGLAMKGKRHSFEHREKLRQAALVDWDRRRSRKVETDCS